MIGAGDTAAPALPAPSCPSPFTRAVAQAPEFRPIPIPPVDGADAPDQVRVLYPAPASDETDAGGWRRVRW
ncbi:hypothetical protein RN629_09205 [Sphingomonadaceae bacterium jetA1]|jgi:hypothetical protein|uniref:hypothetical protein n=1 Tax=Facivitalis istanbulensis TaxID=3075838 RepID=UPI003471EA08